VPTLDDYDDGETGGMMIGKGNRSTWRKPAPVLLCPPQTPHSCPDANLGHHGGKPGTNHLKLQHGLILMLFILKVLATVYYDTDKESNHIPDNEHLLLVALCK
jgi:hypothetical protein